MRSPRPHFYVAAIEALLFPVLSFTLLSFATPCGAARAESFVGPPGESKVGPPSALIPAMPAQLPRDNRQKIAPPPQASAGLAGQAILSAVLADAPEDAAAWFFPPEPFEALKDIPRPMEYYAQLVTWYFADMHRLHARLKKEKEIEYTGFKLGYCVWKDVGSEYNKIPYWSCYHSKILFTVKDAGGERRDALEVRTMINWGTVWYVTHLGHLPKP